MPWLQKRDSAINASLAAKQAEELRAELKEDFDLRKENLEFKESILNFWSVVLGILIAVFGVIIPFISTIVIFRKIRKEKEEIDRIKTEAEDILNNLHCYEEEGLATKEKLQQLSDTDERKPKDMEKAKAIASDEKSTPFEKAWAEALIEYFTAIDFKDERKQNNAEAYFQSAIDKFNELLEKHSSKINFENLAYIYANVGVCYGELDDNNNALFYANNATIFKPNYERAWINKGVALATLKKYKDAIKYFNKAIELDSNNATAWNNKGATLEKLEKNEDAIFCYKRAIEIDPNYEIAKENLKNLEEMIKKETDK